MNTLGSERHDTGVNHSPASAGAAVGEGWNKHGRARDDFLISICFDEWDEFSQAAVTLFRLLGIPYSLVKTQHDSRTVSRGHGSAQIYIGTERIGGAIDLYEKYMSGELARRLDSAGLSIQRRWTFDPARMLLDWMRFDLQNNTNMTSSTESGGHSGKVQQHS